MESTLDTKERKMPDTMYIDPQDRYMVYVRPIQDFKSLEDQNNPVSTYHDCVDDKNLMVRLIKLGLGNGSKDDKTEKNKKAFKSGWELIDKHSKVSQVKFRHPFILGIRLETYKETGDKATVSYYSVVTEKYAILPKDHIKSFRLFGNIAKGLAYLHSKNFVFTSPADLIRSIVQVKGQAKIDPFLAQQVDVGQLQAKKQQNVETFVEVLSKWLEKRSQNKLLQELKEISTQKKLPMRTYAIVLNAFKDEDKTTRQILAKDGKKLGDFINFVFDSVLNVMLDMIGIIEMCHKRGFYSYLLGLLNILHLQNFTQNIGLSVVYNQTDESSNHVIFPDGQLIILTKEHEKQIKDFREKLEEWMKKPEATNSSFVTAIGKYKQQKSSLEEYLEAEYKKKGQEHNKQLFVEETRKLLSGKFDDQELMLLLSKKISDYVLEQLRKSLSEQEVESKANADDIIEELRKRLAEQQAKFKCNADSPLGKLKKSPSQQEEAERKANADTIIELRKRLAEQQAPLKVNAQSLKYYGLMMLSKKMITSKKRYDQYLKIVELIDNPIGNRKEVKNELQSLEKEVRFTE